MKTKLFKNLSFLLSLGLLATSCQENDISTLNIQNLDNQNLVNNEIKFESINFDEVGKLKVEFAQSLSKALVANKDLRRLIKEEALKQFDKDYDVMYQLVKDKSLNPRSYTGKEVGKYSKETLNRSASAGTFRDAILPFFESEAKLKEIEDKLPLLTIFIPELPNGSFSAATWDVNDEQQIPDVALRISTTNDIPVIGRDGFNFVLNAEYIPGWPIIVIKENERMVVKRTSNSKTTTSNMLKSASGMEFEPLDDFLDPNDIGMYVDTPDLNGVAQVLKDSYNVWEGYGSGGWQRDYIYYGLTPTILRGGVTGKYREHITSFKLGGDPSSAFGKISGNQDPQQVSDYRINTSSGWTDGNFEFRVYCYFGSKASNNGASDTKLFSLKPADLFELKYTSYTTGTWFWRKTYYRTEIIATKKINFLDPKYNTRLEFETWDLNRFANEWKFEFEEVDIPTEITKSESLSQKYNMNFALDAAAGGILEKIGLKFGASYEETKSSSYVMKWTTQSDNLAQSVIPFYDNVVNKNPSTGQIATRSYSTGAVEFELRPIQVQW